ncbi:MAG: hypothetical protein ACXU8N_12680 [Telluria sp.]
MDRTRRRKGAVVAIIAGIAASTFVVQHKRAQDAAPPVASAPATAMQVQPAVRALMALPELKAWSDSIEKTSGGKSHGAVVAGEPAPKVIDGKTYLAYSFVENEPEAAHFWQGFYVTEKGDSILVEDAATGRTMSVQQWRDTEHPLDRIKATSAN